MKKFQVPSSKFQVFIFLFLLFTIYYSLFTAVYADDVRARSAVAMEAPTGKVLFAKNPDLKLPAASTIKIMTAIIITENADMNEITTISKRAANQQKSRLNLRKGDRIKIKDLLYAALMESANDAATALAEAITGSEREFTKLMNQKAFEIGATNTRYINANGLPGAGQYTTAYDLAKIMRYAIKNPVIREVLTTKVKEISTAGGKRFFIRNKNRLVWQDDDFIGGKTGFTRMARHCFVGASREEDTEIIIAVLGSPNRWSLWSVSERLFEKGYKISNLQEEPVVYITKGSDIKKAGSRKIIAQKSKKYKMHLRKNKGANIARQGKSRNIQG
ncbi:MAG: D-alanyl-D-alanine carboxypeptidase [Nitrospirae bacterium]|nr:D-alanyl-D-alanine carboxypeptidase [Nitrospirota bacterium]